MFPCLFWATIAIIGFGWPIATANVMAAPSFKCIGSRPNSTVPVPPPTVASPPVNYTVEFERMSTTNGQQWNVTHIRETTVDNRSTFYSTSVEGDTQITYLNSSHALLHKIKGYKCDVVSVDNSSIDPLLMKSATNLLHINSCKNSRDLINYFMNISDKFIDADNESVHEGVPVTRWIGCVTPDNKTHVEFEMSIIGKGQTLSDITFAEGSVVEAYVKIYPSDVLYLESTPDNATNLLSSVVYQFNNWRSSVDEMHVESLSMPPRGIWCDGFTPPLTKPLPSLPARYSVHVNFVDVGHKTETSLSLTYANSSGIQMTSFGYLKSAADVAFIGSSTPKGTTDDKVYHVVHDYNYGLEYVLNGDGACVGIASIPLNSGDSVAVGGTGKQITLKNSTDTLIPSDRATKPIVYQGSRRFGPEGVVSDVWLAEINGGLIEVLYSQEDWKETSPIGSTKGPIPLQVTTFDASGSVRSIQTFSDYLDLSSNSMAFGASRFGVNPCLTHAVSNYSYIYLELSGGGITTVMQGTGAFNFENRMKEEIANLAGVSPLRIANMFLRADGASSMTMFFELTDKSNVSFSENITEGQKSELTAEAAFKQLRSAVSQGKAIQIGTQTFTIVKESMRSIPKEFNGGGDHPLPPPPAPPSSGGGGGSVLVALLMLIMGFVCGIGVAYFLWKRNRGIAYHVYE